MIFQVVVQLIGLSELVGLEEGMYECLDQEREQGRVSCVG